MVAADLYRRKTVGVCSGVAPTWATQTLLVGCGFALGGDSTPSYLGTTPTREAMRQRAAGVLLLMGIMVCVHYYCADIRAKVMRSKLSAVCSYSQRAHREDNTQLR